MLWLHATLLLFLLTVTFISSAAAQTDCSRNYEEPCQSYPGDIQDGDAVCTAISQSYKKSFNQWPGIIEADPDTDTYYKAKNEKGGKPSPATPEKYQSCCLY
ncbi:PREDICTED: uncharacterized protein LOC109584547 isoform X2 [Amphimedon queenslandica]|uniref:Uncharacterized protein n=1 Tax=Amphimedon queenslandica TaxID=400682 RepID=A0AAN0JGV5_AMPQE|nr:PREDICTED: uncharacterized protein LOC109584547 isoform X2 [Amphimedon queenslandica]|eukprot:XP_019855883.1 PREDICTED: uncharacterized protein LOC109584547 isoform X2 [Amphimedon queenslandica]